MDMKEDMFDKAEYDRFIDFMSRMYLKYGSKYRILTMEDIRKAFPERQWGKRKNPAKHKKRSRADFDTMDSLKESG